MYNRDASKRLVAVVGHRDDRAAPVSRVRGFEYKPSSGESIHEPAHAWLSEEQVPIEVAKAELAPGLARESEEHVVLVERQFVGGKLGVERAKHGYLGSEERLPRRDGVGFVAHALTLCKRTRLRIIGGADRRINRIEGRFQRLGTDPLPCTKSVLQSHSAAVATANNFCVMNV